MKFKIEYFRLKIKKLITSSSLAFSHISIALIKMSPSFKRSNESTLTRYLLKVFLNGIFEPSTTSMTSTMQLSSLKKKINIKYHFNKNLKLCNIVVKENLQSRIITLINNQGFRKINFFPILIPIVPIILIGQGTGVCSHCTEYFATHQMILFILVFLQKQW